MIASAKRTTHATDALDESQTRLLLGAEWPPRSREMMIVRRQIRRTFLATGGTSDALARLDKANLNGLKETPRSEGRCSSSCAPKKPGGDGPPGFFCPSPASLVHQHRLAPRAGHQHPRLDQGRAYGGEHIDERAMAPAGLRRHHPYLGSIRVETPVDIREEHIEQRVAALVLDDDRPVSRAALGMAHQLVGHRQGVRARRLDVRQRDPFEIAMDVPARAQMKVIVRHGPFQLAPARLFSGGGAAC